MCSCLKNRSSEDGDNFFNLVYPATWELMYKKGFSFLFTDELSFSY